MRTVPSTECPICGGNADLVREDQKLAIKDREAQVLQEFYRCERCEEEFMTPEQMQAGQIRAVRVIREREGLLQADDILAFRHSNRLGHEQLGVLLGVGPKVIVRWETGTVFQSQSEDTLMRVLIQNPTVLTNLAREKGVMETLSTRWPTGADAWTGPEADRGQVLPWREMNTDDFVPVRDDSVDRAGRAQDLVKEVA